MKHTFFTLRKNKQADEVVGAGLGPLERDVMQTVWKDHPERGPLSVRDVMTAFDRPLAYTTMMTTLDRLHKKGLLERRKDGRAFLYWPRQSPAEIERDVVRTALDALLGRGGAEPALACIIDAVSEHDRALLDELDRMIAEKRRALAEGEAGEGANGDV